MSISTETTTPSTGSARIRRFALRAAVSASVLAGTVVSLSSLAWAAPEIGF